MRSIAIALLLLPMMGCYNLVVLNVGINKTATAQAAPMDAETFCEALTSGGISLQGGGRAIRQAQQFCAKVKKP
jgi:hypothetical protein